VNLVGMEPDERVAAILPIREFVEGGYLLTCTRRGRVKRTNLSAYENIRQTGIIGVAIGEGDGLLTARIVTPGQHVLIGTSRGMSIRFPVEDVRGMGRDSMGVKGVDLREGDFVIGMDIIEENSDQQVLTVSANGYGKRTKVSEWRTQNRGGKGIIGMDTSDRNGALVKLRLVSPDDQLMVITNGGQVIRTRVSEIRETGRNTQGVRVIRLREGEQVVDVEPVAEGEEGEQGAEGENSKPEEPQAI